MIVENFKQLLFTIQRIFDEMLKEMFEEMFKILLISVDKLLGVAQILSLNTKP